MVDHIHCVHVLVYCPHCDAVYCSLCNKQWGIHTHNWYPLVYPVYPWCPQPYPVYPPFWCTTTGDTTVPPIIGAF